MSIANCDNPVPLFLFEHFGFGVFLQMSYRALSSLLTAHYDVQTPAFIQMFQGLVKHSVDVVLPRPDRRIENYCIEPVSYAVQSVITDAAVFLMV